MCHGKSCFYHMMNVLMKPSATAWTPCSALTWAPSPGSVLTYLYRLTGRLQANGSGVSVVAGGMGTVTRTLRNAAEAAGVEFVDVVRPDRGRSPFELGLGRLVHFDKPVFNGRKALLEEREKGSRYRLVRLDVEGNKPAGDSFIYNRKQKVVGHVMSAVWSPSAKMNIALASMEMP